ncbi:MAG: dephospho-CoA kinase [Cyanobacteria bacterium J069]|nr:MAG: dephospho-CoA kinase [Cyanobacteria bacterium J069]
MSDRSPTLTHSAPPRTIGLTGGVGMGKTTISNYLATVRQLPVLDADIYAREAVERGSAVLHEIIERYGPSVLMPNGRLDRARLGEIIFNSPPERLWIEQRIHPYVRDRITAELQELAQRHVAIAIVVVPLLFEARMTDLVNEIWVVNCSREQQIERLRQRDVEGSGNGRLSLEQIHARIDSQMPISQKISYANVIIQNASTLEDLFKQIDWALQSQALPPASQG